jgi:arginine-tRNA-protein transferase
VPTRIAVDRYRPTRSHNRARNQSARLVRQVGLPVVDRERLDLYARWHRDREKRRGWQPTAISEDDYAMEFAFPHPSVREVTFRDPARRNRLVGVGIVDEVPDAVSAVYFFWDPEPAAASLGTAHIVRLIGEAAERGLPYVYLGYRVDGCPSLAYKGRFQPQQSLNGRPADDEEPVWSAALPFEPEKQA